MRAFFALCFLFPSFSGLAHALDQGTSGVRKTKQREDSKKCTGENLNSRNQNADTQIHLISHVVCAYI